MDAKALLKGYDLQHLTVGVLGGHSALDVCHGAQMNGFSTVVVARKGREKTYAKYFKTQRVGPAPRSSQSEVGCVDEVITVNAFEDVLKSDLQQKLRKRNTIFIHSRYFWVYFDDFGKVEKSFRVPIFGSRHLLRLEERDQQHNQYHLLQDAGIRTPKVFASYEDIDRPVLVKASEAARGYERGFFVVNAPSEYIGIGTELAAQGRISRDWRDAVIEEFVIGAPVNFNFFYSPLSRRLELLGTDTRRQTNLEGFLHMTAEEQGHVAGRVPLKRIETGHIAVTVKESLLEKAFELGEKFVKATQGLPKKVDPSGRGIIGPFALQGAVVAEEGREDIVIFDVSFRIPGSPGISATPYSGYLYGQSMSMGERIGLELRTAVEEGRMGDVVT